MIEAKMRSSLMTNQVGFTKVICRKEILFRKSQQVLEAVVGQFRKNIIVKSFATMYSGSKIPDGRKVICSQK